MPYPHIEKANGCLLIVESRYGFGWFAGLTYDANLEALEMLLTGGDNECCGFAYGLDKIPALPARFGSSIEDALKKLEAHLAQGKCFKPFCYAWTAVNEAFKKSFEPGGGGADKWLDHFFALMKEGGEKFPS